MKEKNHIETLNVNETKNQKNKQGENKKILLMVAFIIIVAMILALIFKVTMNKQEKGTLDLDKILKDKQTTIIYVKNSDSKKCKNCDDIEKVLKEKKITYQTYDVNKEKEEDYQSFLGKLYIDKEVFGYPAVIYIKEGIMYSNIINIQDTKVVDQFIKDYNLTEIK